jgi:signal transduction histidine kinase
MNVFSLGIIALTSTPSVTPDKLSPEQQKIVEEVVKGLFSEGMQKTVTTAPTDNFLIYVFLIIAVILIIALVAILKIASNTASKAITSSVAPYVEQLGNFQKAFERSQESYDKMIRKFSALTEEIVRSQTIRENEEDKFTSLSNHFQEMYLRFQDNMTSIFTVFREHEKNSYERQLEMQRFNQKVLMSLLEMRSGCSLVNQRRIGERLVEKGYVTREQLNEITQEQIRNLDSNI